MEDGRYIGCTVDLHSKHRAADTHVLYHCTSRPSDVGCTTGRYRRRWRRGFPALGGCCRFDELLCGRGGGGGGGLNGRLGICGCNVRRTDGFQPSIGTVFLADCCKIGSLIIGCNARTSIHGGCGVHWHRKRRGGVQYTRTQLCQISMSSTHQLITSGPCNKHLTRCTLWTCAIRICCTGTHTVPQSTSSNAIFELAIGSRIRYRADTRLIQETVLCCNDPRRSSRRHRQPVSTIGLCTNCISLLFAAWNIQILLRLIHVCMCACTNAAA
jgi:hypothetical protein